jgi:hypothetical protein
MTFESAYTDPYRLNRDGKGEQPVVPVADAPDNATIKAVIDHILSTTGSPYTVDELTRIKAGL